MRSVYAAFAILVASLLPAAVGARDRADLVLAAQDLTLFPDPPVAGAEVSLSVSVRNLGTLESKATKVLVKVTRKSKRVFKTALHLAPLAPGASTHLPVSLGSYEAGTYNLKVVADPANRVKESSEGADNRVFQTLTVVPPGSNAFVGRAAAAAFGATSAASSSLLGVLGKGASDVGEAGEFADAAVVSARIATGGAPTHGGRGEETRTCSKAGGLETTVTADDTRIRPGIVEGVSPAPGTDPCEEWLRQAPTDPVLGSYARHIGRFSLEISYQSDNPFDPGFFKSSRLVLKTGDGVPGTMNPLPNWVTEYHFLAPGGQGNPVDHLLLIQDADYTADMAILEYGPDGKPRHLRVTLSGELKSTAVEGGVTLTTSCGDFQVEVTTAQDATSTTMILINRGTITVANSLDPDYDFSVTYRDFTRTHRSTEAQTEITVEGGLDVTSACITGPIDFSTLETVVQPAGSLCPTAGKIAVASPMGDATLYFNPDGSMGVDDGSDGTMDHSYASCTEAEPPHCP